MADALTPHSTVPTIGQTDYFLIDGSGSMLDKWNETLDSLDAYLAQLRRDNVNTHILATVFESRVLDDTQRDHPIAQCPTFHDEPLRSHWGATPLYDAINVMGRRLRDLNPSRCSIVIITDGQENASEFTTDVQARAILDWCRAKGWCVTFIGAEFDNSKAARTLGAGKGEMIGVHMRHLTDATAALARKRQRYGIDGSPMHYTKEEEQQFGGFLTSSNGTH